VTTVPDAVHGQLSLVRSPLRFSETPLHTPVAPPRLGDNTEEVLAAHGINLGASK
jgi:crotonobetainyl-CoA:carnitine CoA-transferase CaiB-like acyl-CoA transferase